MVKSEDKVVVININDCFLEESRRSIKTAANRWGVEYIEITKKPPMNYPPQFIKLKLHEFFSFDRVFYIDADTLVNKTCPSPFKLFNDTFAVVRNAQLHIFNYDQVIKQEKYELKNREVKFYFNAGVFYFTKEHIPIFKRAFDLRKNDLNWLDQTPLNIAVDEAKIDILQLDYTWNFYFQHENRQPSDQYIYHFCCVPRYNRNETIRQFSLKLMD